MESPSALHDSPLLTAREAAALLRVTPRTIYLWIRAGKLRAYRISDRVTRIPASEVERLAGESWGKRTSETLPRTDNEGVFWDVDADELDPVQHRRFIIERILEYGRPAHVKWLFRRYGEDEIRDVVATSRALSPRARGAWENMLDWRRAHVS